MIFLVFFVYMFFVVDILKKLIEVIKNYNNIIWIAKKYSFV